MKCNESVGGLDQGPILSSINYSSVENKKQTLGLLFTVYLCSDIFNSIQPMKTHYFPFICEVIQNKLFLINQ